MRNFKRLPRTNAFQLFFEDKLDKKLQYAKTNELAIFVFGSLENAIRQFEREREDWEFLASWKPEEVSF